MSTVNTAQPAQGKLSAIAIKLIDAGVKNLKAYGYPDCNKDNILTDQIYSAFFESMLNDNKGNGRDIDAAINELLAMLAARTTGARDE